MNIPRTIERRASWIKYGILASVVGYFLITKDPLIYPYVEPFWMSGSICARRFPYDAGHVARGDGVRAQCVLPLFRPLGAFLGIVSN